ncbi:MAG: redox-sensing transcriptional repressor Rex [Candidatus Tectomicrobia bacterium]|nr:redox-sensing transcriptional repressor Rex [Candidatus Tectomicrobia bacterium]
MKSDHIPEATIDRLSVYERVLHLMDSEGLTIVSSAALAHRCGFNPAQIRKDLAYFGEFGTRGVGYRVRDLRDALRRILGAARVWRVALVGAGNLGSALLAYQGFAEHGFEFAAVLDKYPARTRRSRLKNVEVLPMAALNDVVQKWGIRIGIIAVPATAAQEVADRLVEAGVSAILNFAPIRLSVPDKVRLRNVDLGLELQGLAYYLTRHERSARTRTLRRA